jgi:cysteine synthase A
VSRDWVHGAIARIEADFTRSADTHLIRLELPATPGITLYLKDESIHPTGSLKHRLARSLFLYALCNGWLSPGTTVVEASSGSTAVSEAYFAKLIGLTFIAVMPRSTSPEKIAAIEFHGGSCHLVADSRQVRPESARLAAECGGHFMDQFTFAERATDWRGNNNIAEAVFRQMMAEPHPIPAWIVCGAGTGGTSATFGRYIRYRRLPTRLCVVDPERSVYHRHHADRAIQVTDGPPSCIEGIGRPCVEPSFMPSVVDRVIPVPDAASIAAMRTISGLLGRRCGGSTGTNIWGCAVLITEMAARGETGSVVTLLCDPGERYLRSYYDDAWVAAQDLETGPWSEQLQAFLATGRLPA